MTKENEVLTDIIWGNRLFVNAQLVISFVNTLTKYSQKKVDLQKVFEYANAIKNQDKVKVYQELEREVDSILLLEKLLKKGDITLEDTDIINFAINVPVLTFTKQSLFDSAEEFSK